MIKAIANKKLEEVERNREADKQRITKDATEKVMQELREKYFNYEIDKGVIGD